LSTEPSATSGQQAGTSASAFTTASVPVEQSSGLPTHLLTGDDVSTNTLRRRKSPGQSVAKLAWLEALDETR
jgi:hypothetical protein